MSVYHVFLVLRDQRRAPDPLELELRKVVGSHLCAVGTERTWVLCKGRE